MKIYCVTRICEEYDDFDIPEIPYFSTEEMANDYANKMGTDYESQEIELDKPYSFDKDLKFEVKLDLNSGELKGCYQQDFRFEYISYGTDSDAQNSCMDRIYFNLYAKNAVEAYNNAKSMLREVKDNLETKYKHLKKPCVRYGQHYFSFPRYEYGTGLILLKRDEELDKVEAEMGKIVIKQLVFLIMEGKNQILWYSALIMSEYVSFLETREEKIWYATCLYNAMIWGKKVK